MRRTFTCVGVRRVVGRLGNSKRVVDRVIVADYDVSSVVCLVFGGGVRKPRHHNIFGVENSYLSMERVGADLIIWVNCLAVLLRAYQSAH